jgi:hypothetical protein
MINQFLKRIRIQRIINFLRILERMKLLTKATFSPIKKQANKKTEMTEKFFCFFRVRNGERNRHITYRQMISDTQRNEK